MLKPAYCLSSCPFARHSTGYVRDCVPEKAIMAIVLPRPGKEELVSGNALDSKAGRHFWHEFMEPLALTREQVIVSSVIRCFPNAGDFPVGKERKDCVSACRHWDDAIKEFRPNLWGVTFHPLFLLRLPSQGKFIRNALARAKEYALEGYRPVLLMGDESKETYSPWLDGAMKKWQGHWWGI